MKGADMQTCAKKDKEKKAVWEARSPYGFRYRLVREGDGYALLIAGADGERCCLSGIAHSEKGALALAHLFAEGEVSPVNAAEVAEELLARDPSYFL